MTIPLLFWILFYCMYYFELLQTNNNTFNDIGIKNLIKLYITCACYFFQTYIGTLTPKVGVHLGMWGFIPSHSLTLLGAWDMTPEIPFWPAPLQGFALIVSPRLGLQYRSMISLKELDLVNEVIKHLRSETSKYIKVDPYVHPNWIFNTIYKYNIKYTRIMYYKRYNLNLDFVILR
jgi:hypothetical protein